MTVALFPKTLLLNPGCQATATRGPKLFQWVSAELLRPAMCRIGAKANVLSVAAVLPLAKNCPLLSAAFPLRKVRLQVFGAEHRCSEISITCLPSIS